MRKKEFCAKKEKERVSKNKCLGVFDLLKKIRD
jgi:hypothetical protein